MSETRLEEVEKALQRLDDYDAELDALKKRAGNFRARELQRIVAPLGYRLKPKGRGEPTWAHPDGYMVAIPDHSKDLGKGLASAIIKTIKGAIFLMREPLEFEIEQLTRTRSKLKSRYSDYDY